MAPPGTSGHAKLRRASRAYSSRLACGNQRGLGTTFQPGSLWDEVMTAEGRMRNAKRLAMAIQRRGGVWYLTEDWSRFLLLGFWAHARLRRRLAELQPELLAELQRVALQNGAGCATAGTLPEPKPERPHTATVH